MNDLMSRKPGGASGPKNLDSINLQNPKLNPQSQGGQNVSLLGAKTRATGTTVLKKILLGIVVVIFVLGATVVLRAANLSDKIFVGQKTTFFGKVVDFIRGGGDNQKLIGEDLGQINVLLLGIGGEGHDGPYLSDTIILAQIRPDIGEITLTSIPRDYLVKLPNASQDKINAAFAYGLNGKAMNWDQAGSWARQVVQQMSGLTIPYFAVVDFSGFEKAINQVGGLDIKIDNTFTDFSYPDNGTGYLPPVTFTAGTEHMGGVRALEFARSRHAAGFEGSDFARGLRQQKIIEAFKQKALGLNLIKDASGINQLLGIFAEHFHTNLAPGSILRLYNLLKDKQMTILPLSLDLDTRLVCPEILASNGAYVLIPCKSEQDIINFFKNSFAVAKLKEEKAIVWLASSTGDRAAYNTAFRQLTDAGVTVLQLSYSKDYLSKTIFYQVDKKPATAEFIMNILGATEASLPPPGVHVTGGKVDIIVVLGADAKAEAEPAPYIPPPARVPSTTPATSTIPTASSTKPH